MYISSLRIRNFRNFQNVMFNFGEGVNTLIGENSSGKTNAFYALRLLIDEGLPRSAVRLDETDFNRGLKRWQGHWIIISVEFIGDMEDEFVNALVNQSYSNGRTATLNLYFRPRREVRIKLHELMAIPDEDARRCAIDDYLNLITVNDYEAVSYGRSSADFNDEETYETIVGRFDDYVFPDPEFEDSLVVGTQISFGYRPEFSCTFAKALRDVVGDLRNSRTSPLLRLLNNVQVNPDELVSITNMITDLNTHIQGLPEIKALAKDIVSSLEKTAGYTYTPDININANISADINQVLRYLRLKAGENKDLSHTGDLSEISLGGANLIYLALKLEEYRRLEHKKKKSAHFLLVEEPEAHLHTHIQKTLFQKYHDHEGGTQVFLSTHSSHISSSCDLDSVNVLQVNGSQTYVCQPAKSLTPKEKRNLERYLDATRSTLLFARSVILVEGDAEEILIPTLVKMVFGLSLDELGVSLINVGSTQFINVSQIFHEDRIRRRCAIITDHDLSIVPLDSSYTDTDYQKKCRNSEVAGIERKKKLDNFCRNNRFVIPFYAKYTFEVDFLLAGNQPIINAVVGEIYTQQKSIADSRGLISDPDVAVSGREVLRLAEKEGKGWLALEMANHVSKDAVIPEYILDALSFVAQINTNHMKAIIKYSLGEEEFQRISAVIGDVEAEEFVREFCSMNSRTPVGQFLIRYQEHQSND